MTSHANQALHFGQSTAGSWQRGSPNTARTKLFSIPTQFCWAKTSRQHYMFFHHKPSVLFSTDSSILLKVISSFGVLMRWALSYPSWGWDPTIWFTSFSFSSNHSMTHCTLWGSICMWCFSTHSFRFFLQFLSCSYCMCPCQRHKSVVFWLHYNKRIFTFFRGCFNFTSRRGVNNWGNTEKLTLWYFSNKSFTTL